MNLSLSSIASALGGEVRDRQVYAPGPGHSENDRSLSVTIDSAAPDGFLVHSFAGDDPIYCKDYVREKLGLPEWKADSKSRVVAEYIYQLADGTPYLRVQRTREKSFWQSKWNGWGWEKGKPHGPKVPYRLPELLKADTAFVCEGEKDADNLAVHGLAATTSSEGSGKWTSDLNYHFAGKLVYVLEDNDDAGRKHAASVAANLQGVAREIRIVSFPNLPEKGDVSDFLARGGSKDALLELCRAAPAYAAAPGTGSTSEGSSDGALVTCLADVVPMPVKWLWLDRIARGKLSIFAGHPGLGKSQATIDLAARVTQGFELPGTSESTLPAHVVMMSAEDDIADTIRPRFEAAGGDLSRMHIVEAVREHGGKRGFDLTCDMARLEEVLKSIGNVALIIIDPISAYLGGKIDSHRNTDVRFALAPLQELAARYGAAVVAVSHLSKQGGDAVTRVIGSMAFAAAARAVFLVARHPHMPDLRVFLPMKNNIGNDATGLAFRIEERAISNGLRATAVKWESDDVTMTADEALAGVKGGRGAGVEEAVNFLRGALSGGSRYSKDVEDEAKMRGISHDTLRNARKKLGVIAKLRGPGGKQQWLWELPGAQKDMPF